MDINEPIEGNINDDKSIKLVFGTYEHDGLFYKRWAICYFDRDFGNVWRMYDQDETIDDVERVVEFDDIERMGQ